jgi:hypothetical protein
MLGTSVYGASFFLVNPKGFPLAFFVALDISLLDVFVTGH